MGSGKHTSFTGSDHLRQADLAECQDWLPRRPEDSHKGSNGRVLIVGGEQAMAGATCLAGWAAYIAGAGLVRVATIPDNVSAITGRRPELLVSGIAKLHQLKSLLNQSDIVALGPGLGQTKWSHQVFELCLEHRAPDIVDADGLNLLAHSPEKRPQWILTPHAGEAARLLRCSVDDVQSDRTAAINEITSIYGGTCILKGPGSLISDNSADTTICLYGNAALAVAGTGDVLSGFLSGLIAQKMDLQRAAVSAVVLHACAADIYAAEHGTIGMLASDLMIPLRRLRNDYRMRDDQ